MKKYIQVSIVLPSYISCTDSVMDREAVTANVAPGIGYPKTGLTIALDKTKPPLLQQPLFGIMLTMDCRCKL
jgi:hypothetical protein